MPDEQPASEGVVPEHTVYFNDAIRTFSEVPLNLNHDRNRIKALEVQVSYLMRAIQRLEGEQQ